MGDVVIAVLDYARKSDDEFVVGPFDAVELLAHGLEVAGAVDGVVDVVRRAYPNVSIEVDGG
jgi:hypothetical protein